jgi:hypothetical protein
LTGEPTVSRETSDQPAPLGPVTEQGGLGASGGARALAMTGARIVCQAVVVVVLSAGLFAGLVAGGLVRSPLVAAAAPEVNLPPRRPPIIPPSVPLGAREDWAIWSYVDKINQAWGKDWPLAIQWFEELDARYPGNPMVLDKLYVSYLEDGRNRQLQGDVQGARQRYEQAARYDPDRGVAQEMLAELDKQRTTPGR